MARELAPAGLRSSPNLLIAVDPGFTTAAQPSGSKLPRHRGPVLQTNGYKNPRLIEKSAGRIFSF
ncbi:hypothetical protein EAH78_19830 [Pseudomonas arsenicoxydans]|uniref:Uncharacterized protein n=1 Tax=Pseudomonas arsenicoxydans TaxID=702115 RepID=A0A502HM21_9PSED|nr:hypothetical protein EAH78_19830 [Pseudomonas arsenicoxydans]